MSDSDNKTLAAQLKNTGNTFFAAKKYQAAYNKYSEAIRLDDNSAILYANRAACSQNLRKLTFTAANFTISARFLDAASDAKKATEVDGTYPKAWARLAAAQSRLGNDQSCVDSWKKALLALPIENLTAVELRQKGEYESELKTAQSKLLKTQTTSPTIIVTKDGQTPWQCAIAMEDDISSRPNESFQSSAFVIAGAYRDWQDGEKKMKMQKVTRSPQGMSMMSGWTGAIASLTNAILRDDRIFHMSDSRWTDMYNKQVSIEAQQVGAWVDIGPKQVIVEAVKRQHTQGWNAVRPALSTTIRLWIMRGFMEQTIRQNHDVGVEFIGRALEVLRWGLNEWKDVPEEQKGAIFVNSFIRGVHSLYLETYMKATMSQPGKFSLETLLKEAQDLLADFEVIEIPIAEPGFFLSFTAYLRGRAFAMIGFYNVQKAKRLFTQKIDDVKVLFTHWREAADAYVKAANSYPPDDEMHIWFLTCACQNYFLAGTPLSVTLPLLERIRVAYPNVMKIWRNSALSVQSGDTYQTAIDTEQICREGLEDNKLTMDSDYLPDGLISQLPTYDDLRH
ncbi:hypothetical protein EUX98_g5764 [Antrodiella citrinella]|uniref:Uncharacterized protein n=1 Tax=Antrodiella citrinella TaxID=2447956 RepID=A0A4S4MSV7_9APHY|nr:hypothetical protein EUX98_g5764 [Antrodiella citrinella]